MRWWSRVDDTFTAYGWFGGNDHLWQAEVGRRDSVTILTIGHSTRPLDEFIELLRLNGVTLLVDVRTVPRSRHNPQFNQESLPESLSAHGIAYQHLPELGGLRKTRKDSPNTGWENASFRGYADYMQTPEFEAALKHLIDLADEQQAVLMCAEAVPWRCHRSLIADALVVRGITVEHILGPTSRRPHTLRAFAHVDGTRITYPPEEPDTTSDEAAAPDGGRSAPL
jgi:hypothetical protein